MPLNWNEIKDRALAFSREWAEVASERAEAQSFWNAFFEVFGVNRRRVATFEKRAARFSGSLHGRIDVFWPGILLAEHKSAGRDLDAAFHQVYDALVARFAQRHQVAEAGRVRRGRQFQRPDGVGLIGHKDRLARRRLVEREIERVVGRVGVGEVGLILSIGVALKARSKARPL